MKKETEVVEGGFANEGRAFRNLLVEQFDLQYWSEAVKNAFEAPNSTFLKVFPVKVGKAFKACLLNDGKGLDLDELRALAYVNAAPKAENGKTEDHFNSGARLTGLKSNQAGLVFLSRANGEVNTGRLYLSPNGLPTVALNEEKYLVLARKVLKEVKGDATAVVLFGNSVGQNTFTQPFGKLSKQTPWAELFQVRFYRANKPFTLTVDGEVVTPLANTAQKHKEWRVKYRKGLTFVYRLYDNDVDAVSGFLTKGEHFDEVFDAKKGKAGTNSGVTSTATPLLAGLGALKFRGRLSVFVEVEDTKLLKQTQKRTGLLYTKTGNDARFEEFYDKLSRFLPTELKDLFHEENKKALNVESSVTSLLRRLLQKLPTNLQTLAKTKESDELDYAPETVFDKLERKLTDRKKKKNKTDDPREGGEVEGLDPEKEVSPVEKKQGLLGYSFKLAGEKEVSFTQGQLLYYQGGDTVSLNPEHPLFADLLSTAFRESGTNLEKAAYFDTFVSSLEVLGNLGAVVSEEYGLRGSVVEPVLTGAVLAVALSSLGSGEFERELKKAETKGGN